jgi:hypothetical protein
MMGTCKLCLAVQSAEPGYTKGLSRYAHQVHLQYTKKYLKGATDVLFLMPALVESIAGGIAATACAAALICESLMQPQEQATPAAF